MLSRETRLLLATIAISAVVVLVLSTMRFPESPRLAEAPPTPLERLAASAAYDQLARIVDRVARRVRPDLLVVRSSIAAPDRPRGLSDLLTQPVTAARHYPALRIDNERAVLATDAPPEGVVLLGGRAGDVEVLATDTLRQLTLLSVPPAEATSVLPLTLSQLQTPTYVVIAEGTAAGIAFRPVFVGSADRFSDPRWARSLLAVSGTALTNAGALVFSLEGQFIGAAVVPQNGTFAIVGAAELLAAASELVANDSVTPRDFGITVQALTAPLARVLSAESGLVVVSVDPNGAAAGVLEPLDVITAVENSAVTRPEQLLLRLARTRAGATVQLRGFRGGEAAQWTLPGTTSESTRPPVDDVSLERVMGTGTLVRSLGTESPLAHAGLAPGDMVVRAGTVEQPTPAQLTALLRGVTEGRDLALIVRRDGGEQVIAVPGRVTVP